MIFPRVHYAFTEFRGGRRFGPPLNTPLIIGLSQHFAVGMLMNVRIYQSVFYWLVCAQYIHVILVKH